MYVPDASVWVARFWRNDPVHEDALRWLERVTQYKIPLYAPTILLAEVAGAVSRRVRSERAAMEAVDEIKVMASADEITFYEVDEVLADVSAASRRDTDCEAQTRFTSLSPASQVPPSLHLTISSATAPQTLFPP